MRQRFYHRKKSRILMWVMLLMFIGLTGRLAWVMVFRSGYYLKRADDVQERERKIKAARGVIYDCNSTVLAGNRSVCTVTVIYNQMTDSEKVIQVLSKELSLDEAYVRARVEKKTSIERIKSNVSKDIGDTIRSYKLDGVNVDEDYARIYPYEDLASKVIGFTGGDNQGIIGVEVMYDAILAGTEGRLLTKTDVRGIEVENADEHRIEPVRGYDLYLTLDYQVQMYVQQIAEKICAQKQAKSVSVILMNPQDGSIYAMVNVPEFNLNEPFTLTESLMAVQDESNTQDLLNQMWRNSCINDTYEPGSSFKIVTATAALEEKVVTLNDMFSCPGYRIVEDRRIRCHKTVGHGSETFEQGFMNSCNPVFMDVGARVGAENLYVYFEKLGLFEKTGVDLPGESGSIMHQVENIGAVELATISFGQSFQITPLQLLRAVSAVINGGILVTPHVAAYAADEQGNVIEQFEYQTTSGAVSSETSETMKELLRKVVAEGTGKNAYIEGYNIGGKTATSQKLPRGSGKYIASFVGFAPTDEPQIVGIVMIDEPVGTYYGGVIAAPVMKEIFDNILPYLHIERVNVI